MQADASLYWPEANVDFYQYDPSGRILQKGRMARGFVLDKIAAGEHYSFGTVDDLVHYIDTSAGEPVVKQRPVIDWGFNKTAVMPREEARLADIPPAEIWFRGPTRGRQPHEAFGPVEIGWTTPGDYTVTIEAFPYLPATFQLTVKGKVSVNIGVTL